MYLGPHHFQIQSRYFEDSIHFAASALWHEPYGFIGCGLSEEALRNGTLALLHARGVLPDGLPFHMPECDPLPSARNIVELFPPTRDKVTILLAIPSRRPNGPNCALGGSIESASSRFLAEPRPIVDETTGRDEKPVQLGRKNFSLLLDTEQKEDVLALPVARVMRDGSGNFVADPSFIPPCTQISASERLMQILKRLIEILEDKSVALSAGSRTGARSWTDYSTRDIAQFWLLHTVNSALAPLRQMFSSRRVHPEELFVELLRLGGALCTFAMESHPRDLPGYDHTDLSSCFDAIDHHIRTHLETIIPTSVVSISLNQTGDFFWEGAITDQRCLDRSRWIFSVRAPLGEVEIISATPRLVKICSAAFVPKLVERALPGMTLSHMPVPPAAIAARVDVQYFSVSKAGPCWEHIVQTRQVGVYVPGEIPSPELELLVVLES
jgi:type VI secretion system protein ImpJ